MMKKRNRLAALFCLVVASAAGNCFAQVVLLGNYPPANDANFNSISTTAWKAAPLVMPSQDYTINSVDLRLSQYSTGDSAYVAFYTGSATAPNTAGSPVGVLTANQNGGALADIAFTPTAPFNLSSGQTYWLVVGANSGSFFWFASNDNASNTPDGVATFGSGGYRTSSNGATGPWSGSASGTLNTFQINATAVVPEPAHYALLAGAGLICFGFVRKYSKLA